MHQVRSVDAYARQIAAPAGVGRNCAARLRLKLQAETRALLAQSAGGLGGDLKAQGLLVDD